MTTSINRLRSLLSELFLLGSLWSSCSLKPSLVPSTELFLDPSFELSLELPFFALEHNRTHRCTNRQHLDSLGSCQSQKSLWLLGLKHHFRNTYFLVNIWVFPFTYPFSGNICKIFPIFLCLLLSRGEVNFLLKGPKIWFRGEGVGRFNSIFKTLT